MDIVDVADDLIAQQIASSRALAAKFVPHAPTGACLNCDEPVSQGLFCEADCRNEHARRESARHRTGAH